MGDVIVLYEIVVSIKCTLNAVTVNTGENINSSVHILCLIWWCSALIWSPLC